MAQLHTGTNSPLPSLLADLTGRWPGHVILPDDSDYDEAMLRPSNFFSMNQNILP